MEEALSPISEDFAGKLLEVPVGTGVLTMPLGYVCSKGLFTPPFETKESLKKRLDSLYSQANVHTVNAEGIFCCMK